MGFYIYNWLPLVLLKLRWSLSKGPSEQFMLTVASRPQGNALKTWKGDSSEPKKARVPANKSLSSTVGEEWLRSGWRGWETRYLLILATLQQFFWTMGTICFHPQGEGALWYLKLNTDIIRKRPRSRWKTEYMNTHCHSCWELPTKSRKDMK